MDQLRKMRAKSNRFGLILILQIGFCALLDFLHSRFRFSVAVTVIYYVLLVVVPLAYNIYWYLWARRKNDAMNCHYAIISQVLVLLFIGQFLT